MCLLPRVHGVVGIVSELGQLIFNVMDGIDNLQLANGIIHPSGVNGLCRMVCKRGMLMVGRQAVW